MNFIARTPDIRISVVGIDTFRFSSLRSYIALSVFVVFVLSPAKYLWAASSQCFSQAETYYEQVFCEIKSKGKGQTLPNYADFKRNNDITQALLLKRDAAKIGIKLKMPKRSVSSSKSNPVTVAKIKTLPSKISAAPVRSSEPKSAGTDNRGGGCQFFGNLIRCKDSRFLPVGNKRNPRLAKSALASNNLLGLAVFKGSLSDTGAVEVYLYESYTLYLNKMLEIGLGAVTMSYSKFAFLFYDLHEKGVSFSQRFETMFTYLKKDKLTMAVSEAAPNVSGLTLEDCSRVTDKLFACEQRTRNYLFIKTL